MKKLNLSYQKSKVIYPEPDNEKRKFFIELLKKTKKTETTEEVIVYEHECSLSNTATISYSWGEIGKQPKIKQKQNKRERQTFFGCVEPQTGIVIAKRSNKGNAREFKRFSMKVINRYKGKKVIIVLNNVRYHHAKTLKPFLKK